MAERSLSYWKGALLTMEALYEAAIKTARMYALAMERARREIAAREAKILVVVVLAFFVGGCRAVSGFGSMVEGAGQDIKAASDGYMNETQGRE